MASTSLAASLATARTLAGLERTTRALADSVYRLSSGNRYTLGQDSAALSVAAQLQAGAAVARQGFANSTQASSLLDIASAGLTRISDLLTNARATAVAAQSDALTTAERGYLQTSLESDLTTIDAIAADTSFGSVNLLDGSLAEDDGGEALTYAVGSGDESIITVEIRDASTDRLLGGTTPSLASSDDADDAVDAIDAAIALVDEAIAQAGGDRSRVDYATENLKAQIGGLEAGASDISDTDFTEESTRYAIQAVKQNAALSLIAQSKSLNGGLLSLLNFGNPTTGTPASNALSAAARSQQSLFFTNNE